MNFVLPVDVVVFVRIHVRSFGIRVTCLHPGTETV